MGLHVIADEAAMNVCRLPEASSLIYLKDAGEVIAQM